MCPKQALQLCRYSLYWRSTVDVDLEIHLSNNLAYDLEINIDINLKKNLKIDLDVYSFPEKCQNVAEIWPNQFGSAASQHNMGCAMTLTLTLILKST